MGVQVFLFFFVTITYTYAVTVSTAEIVDIEGASPTEAPLGCHRRMYTYRVAQFDAKGRECWDHVTVQSCWGRCDSNEISDWKFPYKKSHHPVCVHNGRVEVVAVLRNCDPDVEPETRQYKYMEAKSCLCQTCMSLDTSCEAPKQILNGNAIKVLQLAGQGDDLDY